MTKKYEIMYILDQDCGNVKDVQDKLHKVLTTKGKIVETADWGLMDFAYEINHKKKGHYTVVIVESTPQDVAEFERISRIDKNVVRTLVLNTETVQHYEQSTKLSKTDMTKYEEERREKKAFRRPFPRRDDDRRSEDKPAAAPTPATEPAA